MTTSLTLPVVPDRGDGVWDYISASRLNLWLKCPLAFKFRYIDGIRTPTTQSLFIGKRTHDALEMFYRHRQLGVQLTAEQLTGRIGSSWDEAAAADGMTFESADDAAAARQQVVRLVETYLKHVPHDEPLPLAVETSLEAPLVDPMTGEDLGIKLLGIVDLVLDGQDGPVICDFKTAASSSPPLELAHEIQLTCYAYLLHQATGLRETGLEIRSLIKTKKPQMVFHRYPARRLSHMRRLFAVGRLLKPTLHDHRSVTEQVTSTECVSLVQYRSSRHGDASIGQACYDGHVPQLPWNGDEIAFRELAPGWKLSCLKCGFSEDCGKYGVRLWAAGKTYTVGWCARCRRIGCHVIEKDAKANRS